MNGLDNDLKAWAAHQAKPNQYGTPEYSRFVCHVMNLFDPRAKPHGHACEWVAPYGFVPEAGCPLHD